MFLLPARDATRAQSETRSPHESRRTASAILLGVSSAAMAPDTANADLPQWEDFNRGTGSKMMPSAEELAEMQQNYDRKWKMALESPLPDMADRALAKLQEIGAYLKEANVDA